MDKISHPLPINKKVMSAPIRAPESLPSTAPSAATPKLHQALQGGICQAGRIDYIC